MSSTELNLWSSFLRESSKRTQSLESTCIIVGDEHCGKRQLSSVLCGVDNSKESTASYSSVVSYNYFDIDDKDMETTARVNTWLFERNIFDSSHAVLKNACKTDKVCSVTPSYRIHVLIVTILFLYSILADIHAGSGSVQTRNLPYFVA